MEVTRGLSYHYEMFGLQALLYVGYGAKYMGVTLGSSGSSFFSYKMPETSIGMIEVVKYLKYKYDNNMFVSYSSMDFSDLAHNFWHLSHLSEFSDMDLFNKGDSVYIAYKNGNTTSVQSDSVRAINLWLF